MEKSFPELALIYAIPNGGLRHVRVAMKMKREGVKRSIPDVHLPVPKSTYCGLYIEFKARRRGDGTKTYPTPDQREMHEKLRAVGHHVVVCWTAEDAWKEVLRYLKGE